MEVTFKDVTLSYDGKREILHHLNFTIPEGTLVSILGPSGCGKSTTLMMISGLLAPTSGQIFFGDQDVTKKDALARKVGMVFQNYALYPHLSVLDNIEFPLKMAKVSKKDRKKKAIELAKLVHIDDQLDKKPGALSGGQQQRVAIARALAKEPSLLLLDEPLSNLDARLRIEMRQEIRRIQQETGVTTIFVTHDQDEALHISDHIMVLNQGHIQQFSSAETLYDNPSNLFVAQFIGEPVINTLDITDFAGELDGQIDADILQRTQKVGIRPEALQDHNTVANTLATITTKVTRSEKYGREKNALLEFHGQRLLTTEVQADVTDGQELPLYLQRNGVYLFDKDGVRIFGGDQDA
ncbi:ABC transporter ATP-binding protein [Lapidilactobacillus bayanensis]|uniref:ABC transporter ATP-binding protein n=1 Tax=Lapidilactobacillus bayanensis TaxID=2485998 RepID=UPI000F7B4BA6|nr:ABC transporter ATP-binding protein [Lapidilactobacillus bayanensis]